MLNAAYILLAAAFLIGAVGIWRYCTVPQYRGGDYCPNCGHGVVVARALPAAWIVACPSCGFQTAESEL
jgi:hypothetical protein